MDGNGVILFNIQDMTGLVDSLKYLATSYSSSSSADDSYTENVTTSSFYNPSVEVNKLSVSDAINSSTDLSSYKISISKMKTVTSFFTQAVDSNGESGRLVELMKRFYRMEALIMHDVGMLETIITEVESLDEANSPKK